jgi:hypothetical protein
MPLVVDPVTGSVEGVDEGTSGVEDGEVAAIGEPAGVGVDVVASEFVEDIVSVHPSWHIAPGWTISELGVDSGTESTEVADTLVVGEGAVVGDDVDAGVVEVEGGEVVAVDVDGGVSLQVPSTAPVCV